MLQCVAVCCSALQCVAVCGSVMFDKQVPARDVSYRARCSVLQCVAVRCSALQCVAVRCSALQCVAVRCSALQCVVVRGIVVVDKQVPAQDLSCRARCSARHQQAPQHACCTKRRRRCGSRTALACVCCSVLQYVAECCSVLHLWTYIHMRVARGVDDAAVRVQHLPVCCSVLQRVAVCCSVLQ